LPHGDGDIDNTATVVTDQTSLRRSSSESPLKRLRTSQDALISSGR
jgi:hypothetical protein